jgi:dolichol-phosphate mannosyltransferase
VVVPCYNEAAGIRDFHQQTAAVLSQLGGPYDFVFVDDGSRDDTLAILNALANQYPNINVLSFSRNFGHQIALTAGLDHAGGEVVITMDADLQHPPASIPDLVAAYRAGADIVYGVRENDDNRSWIKSALARNFYRFLSRSTRVQVLEGAVDFRLMSAQCLAVLHTMREKHRYLRGMVPWLGFESSIVHYRQAERFAGQSSYSWRQLARLARHGLFSFSTVPLDVITLLGLVLNGLACLYLIYILLAGVFSNQLQQVPGWTSVIIVLLVTSGIQLISLGVMSQYLGMIFEEVKGRPLYILKQKRLSPPPSPEDKA